MGLMTVVGLAMGAATIYQGYAANEDAKDNAAIKRVQAGMIDNQKQLQAAQDDRAIRFATGAIVSSAAGRGLEMSGSPMAIMIDTQTQMEMDKAIGQYNLEVQKRFTMAEAGAIERSGQRAMTAGVVGGLTQMFASGMDASTSKSTLTKKTPAIKTTGKSGYGSRSSAYKSLNIN